MDRVPRDVRSRIMANIRSVGTSIELEFSRELRRSRVSFVEHPSTLGRPDVVFSKPRVVVFLDSCFWHRCPYHFRPPKSRQEYWVPKIARNVKRDKEVRAWYRREGWKVLRFWEHQIKGDLDGCIVKTLAAVAARRRRASPSPQRDRRPHN